MRYYIRAHPITLEPWRLYRVNRRGRTHLWQTSKWVPVNTPGQPEMDGLGGSTDYTRIPEGEVSDWQSNLDLPEPLPLAERFRL